MANNFKITISAIDKTTATVRKINNGIGKSFRPLNNMGRSLKMLGREVGLGQLGSKIAAVGKSAATTTGHLAGVAAPLTAIVGGASIAGIAALATEWSRLGAETARTATTLGLSTGYLQSMRGAAVAAGLSSDAMTGSLKSLGDTMQDATYGRNQMALSMLSQLGIGIHRTKGGAVDTARAFNDMSRAISNIKSPQVQGLVARTFGLEAVLPLLRQGPAAIAAYQKKVESLGGVMSSDSIQAAERFGLSLNYLKVATEGVRNTIGDRLMPILNPLVDKFTEWLGKNRELIATRVAEFVEDFARWLEKVDFNKVLDGITGFIKGVGDAVEWIGGWKNAAILLGAVMAGPLILSVVTLTGNIFSLGMGIAKFIPLLYGASTAMYAFATSSTALGGGITAGLTKLAASAGLVAAAGAVGWAIGSVINKSIEGTDFADSIGRGIAKTLAFFGNEEAKESLAVEERSKANRNAPAVPAMTSVAKPQAAEKSATPQTTAPVVPSMTSVAKPQAAEKSATPQTTAPVVPSMTSVAKPQAAEKSAMPQTTAPVVQTVSAIVYQQAAAARAAAPQNISVDVNFKNAPPGTSASARNSGNGYVPVRVAHAMSGA